MATMKSKNWMQKIIGGVCSLAAALTVFFALKPPIFEAWLYYTAFVACLLLTALSLFFPLIKFPRIYKLIFLADIIAVIIAATYAILHYSGAFAYIDSREKIQALVSAAGAWGYVILFALNLLQVIVLPIPAAVTVVAGAYVYNPTISFLIATAAGIIGSVVCFVLGRKFGKKLAAWVAGKEDAEKYAKILSEKGQFIFIAMQAFPFFPDDLLCIVAGYSKMSFLFFIITIVITRPIMLAFYSYFGTQDVLAFDLAGILIRIAIILGVLLGVLIAKLIYDKATKKKNVESSPSDTEGRNCLLDTEGRNCLSDTVAKDCLLPDTEGRNCLSDTEAKD